MIKEPKLTLKQRRFVEYFLESGNASDAARRAGYSPKTADSTGRENIRKPAIAEYIRLRVEAMDAKLVASADEVLKFYSAVMRGEVTDQFGLDPSLQDRIKAADSLMKRYAVAEDRQKSVLEKLDKLFEDFRNAVDTEAD